MRAFIRPRLAVILGFSFTRSGLRVGNCGTEHDDGQESKPLASQCTVSERTPPRTNVSVRFFYSVDIVPVFVQPRMLGSFSFGNTVPVVREESGLNLFVQNRKEVKNNRSSSGPQNQKQQEQLLPGVPSANRRVIDRTTECVCWIWNSDKDNEEQAFPSKETM